MDRREFIAKSTAGFASILAAGEMPASIVRSMLGIKNGVAIGKTGDEEAMYKELYESLIQHTITDATKGNDSITVVRSYAFWGCSHLVSAAFPAATSIGEYAFRLCKELTSCLAPICASVNANAFHDCSKIEKIEFPLATFVGQWCFQNCTSLTEISFPLLGIVRNNLCNGCPSLRKVNIPMATQIQASAFTSTSVLEVVDMSLGSTVATLQNVNAFSKVPSTCRIVVPDALVTSYKTANNWTNFADLIIGRSEAIQDNIIS